MDFSIISNACRCIWNEISNRTLTWFKLSFGSHLMLLLSVGFYLLPFIYLPILISGLMVKAQGADVLSTLVFLSIFFGLYLCYYAFATIGSIPSRNVLDHFEKKKLRMFENRVTTHKLALVMLVYVAAVIVGTMLFILPGVVIAVHYRYAYWVMLDKQCSVSEAFSESWELTKDNFWQLLIATMVANVIDALRFVNVIFPVTSLFEGSIYYQLKTSKNKK